MLQMWRMPAHMTPFLHSARYSVSAIGNDSAHVCRRWPTAPAEKAACGRTCGHRTTAYAGRRACAQGASARTLTLAHTSRVTARRSRRGFHSATTPRGTSALWTSAGRIDGSRRVRFPGRLQGCTLPSCIQFFVNSLSVLC